MRMNRIRPTWNAYVVCLSTDMTGRRTDTGAAPDPYDTLAHLAAVLRRAGIPYAVGGSIALGFHAEPRATIDVDVNVFLGNRDEIAGLVDLLESAGYRPDEPRGRLMRRALEDSQFRVYFQNVRVDVFPATNSYYAEFPSRVRHFDDGTGGEYPVLGAEDIAVLKCVFNRPKDDADLVNLCEHCPGLDIEFVKRKLGELLGEDDSRIANFERIVASNRIAGTEDGPA